MNKEGKAEGKATERRERGFEAARPKRHEQVQRCRNAAEAITLLCTTRVDKSQESEAL